MAWNIDQYITFKDFYLISDDRVHFSWVSILIMVQVEAERLGIESEVAEVGETRGGGSLREQVRSGQSAVNKLSWAFKHTPSPHIYPLSEAYGCVSSIY